MKILLIGPQGSGKSTQADLLANYLKVPKISTGDIFRHVSKQDSEKGQRLKNILGKGKLVDDKTTSEIVKDRLSKEDCKNGFVVDGYPRSLEQNRLFDPGFDWVFYLQLKPEVVMERLLKRGREDDTQELIKTRLKIYYQQTEALLDYYKNLGILIEIDGEGTIEEVYNHIRNSYELILIKKSGEIAAAVLKKALESVKVGVSGLDLDKIAQDEIYRLGGDLSYKSVPGYKHATCITVNEQVVHGIPSEKKFVAGDLVSVDLAVEYRGWHTDCAWSVLVDGAEAGKKTFLATGEQALWDGISQAVEGSRVGDISNAIQTRIEGAGYSVVRSLVGHGVGKSLHEEPEIPGYGQKGTGMFLKEGMALAIEVIYAMGRPEVVLEQDGWTFTTEDRSLSGLFEMTVIVGKKQAEVLTRL